MMPRAPCHLAFERSFMPISILLPPLATQALSPESATRVSAWVRSHCRARRRECPAMAWPDFNAWLRALPGRT
jgi:hypothetical protein